MKVKDGFDPAFIPVVKKLANLSSVETVADFGSVAGVSFMVRTVEMFIELSGLVNVDEEIAKLEKELEYQQKFLAGVRAKLANERFTAHAPEAVIANERKKEADSLLKIESYQSQLKALKNN